MNLKTWMAAASPADKQKLAHGAKTSINYLYQLAGGHREASAEMGAALEKASKGDIRREETVAACAACPYAKACKAGKA